MSKRPKRKVLYRHAHRFLLGTVEDGKGKIKYRRTKPINVFRPKTTVTLELIADDVILAEKVKGWADTQRCALSQMIRRQAHMFSHRVSGLIDLTYSRAFIGAEANKEGDPIKCFRYEHRHGHLAKLFDEGKKGRQKLLALIKEAGGMIPLTFIPFRDRSDETSVGKKTGRTTGERSKVIAHGGKARFIHMKESAVYVPEAQE